MKKPRRTQWFDVTSAQPVWVGRYLVKSPCRTRPIFRWWNGSEWQYNRRKKGTSAHFGHRPGDMWAGAADLVLDPTKEKMASRMNMSSVKYFKHMQRSLTWVGLRV